MSNPNQERQTGDPRRGRLELWAAYLAAAFQARNRRVNKLVTLALTIAIICGSLGRPQAASAEGYGALIVPDIAIPYSYGEPIYGEGRLYAIAACTASGTGDAIGTASDVWLVKSDKLTLPTPFAVPLESIGTKVGLISVTVGSTFDYERIGFIANSLYGGDMTSDISGSYKIVLDNCQDGEFNGNEDYVHDQPLMIHQSGQPDTNTITAAASIKDEWRTSSKRWNALYKALTGLIVVATGTVAVANAYNKLGAVATAWLGVGATVLGYVALLASDVSRAYEALAADPPDPQYKQWSSLPSVLPFVSTTSDPLLEPTLALANAAANEAAAGEMLLHSLERYQGAQLEGRHDWQLVHARALRSQIALLKDQVARSDAAALDLSAALAADTRPLDSYLANAETLRARLASSGLTSVERMALMGIGLSGEQVDRFLAELSALSFNLTVSEVQGALAELRAAGVAQSAELDTWAGEIDQVISNLEADPFTGDPGPVARAGGPYAAQVGTAFILNATASTSPVAITSYAWDLDRDGAFDDATGATPSVTFPRPGQQLLGLRVVNEYGLANVDYVAVAVTPTNRSPRFDSVSAGPEDADLTIGATWPVSVTVSDPDGDAVGVEWLLDGAVVGSGLSYNYTPGEADVGLHTLQAVASNPSTSADPTRHSWAFGVGGRDVDGDGWRSHLDCNDGDPDVNPGKTEVIGNGKDDDCNAGTTDAGGPPVVKFNPQGGGRNIALLDAGASVHSFSSQSSTSASPGAMIDYRSSDAGWRTASGPIASQWAIITLAGGNSYQIDRVKLQPGSGNEGVKQFSVAVATASPQGPYTTVLTATAALNGLLQEYVLPEPVNAKYVKFTPLSTQVAGSCCVTVRQFKVYTAQEGERAVSFANLTADSDNDITSWQWSFGDGTTSTLREPSHTYPAESRSYTVSLTVKDAGGNTAAYTLPYRVLLPPVASFTVTPAAPNEGARATLTDTSSDPDGQGMIGVRVWTWENGSTQTLTTAATEHTFPDSGAMVVRLQVVDLQEQVTTLEKAVPVVNVPPTLTPAAAQTLVWGQPMDMAAIILSDVSPSDRFNLTCDWSFGDGESAHIERCTSGTARLAHAYANPGAYSASLRVSDPDGGAITGTTAVTVRKRDSFVQVLNVRNSTGGQVEITARAFDTYTWAPLPDWNVSFSAGSATATARTDTTGTAMVTLPRAAGVNSVGVSVDATSHYNGSAMERLIEAPLGDIVFIIDESGSMQDDQQDLRRNLNSIAMQLAAKVDFQIGVVGFGAARGTHGTTINGQGHRHMVLGNDVGAIGREIAGLAANGGYEAGFDGTRVAMDDTMGFRANAGTCAVLISDDWADFGGDLPTTREQAVAALKSRNAVFFGIVASGVTGVADHYGMNPGSLAAETGGQTWNITSFRANPQPVLDAITAKCLAYITRIDLRLSVTDGQETARIGDELTYALAVANTSTGLARTVALTDTLPTGTSFVGASDGGTLANGKVTWPAFDLAAGQSLTRTLTVKLDGQLAIGAAITNTATVADDGQSGPDRSPADNTASDITTMQAPLNTAPLAQDQSGRLPEDSAALITLGASDAEGDTLTYTIVTGPQHGTLSGTAPALTYTPAANYHGPDSFTFKVSDATLDSNLATVSITVTPANDAPTAVAGPDQAVTVGTGVSLDGTQSSDLDGDTLSFAWQQTDGPSATLAGADSATPSFTPGAAGSYSFKLTVGDGSASAEDTVTIIVEPRPNQAPQAQDDAVTTAENSAVVVDVLANDSDADGDALSVSAVGAAANGAAALVASGADAGKVRYTPAAGFAGIDSFTYTVDDGKGGTAQGTISVIVTAVNDAPVVTAGADQATDEGGSVTVSATFSDAESGEQQYTCMVSWGDGQTSAGTVVAPHGAEPGTCTATYTYADDNPTGTPSDSYAVSITVTDSGSPAASGGAALTATVNNVAPTIGGIVAPAAPVSLGTAVEATITLSDVGATDSHSCAIAWGDGTNTTATASNSACAAAHTYASPGVYTVGVTVADDDGGRATGSYQYVVVYDPNGGFVTGGGWISSPAGACQLTEVCGSAVGRANFGFVAKYKKGASVPEGQTEFQFKAGGLNFHSGRYDWLVVAGAKAQYKGTGTINGQGSYGFMVTAVDGQLNGGGGTDKFRIKIWDIVTGAVVYDNQMDAGDDAEPTTVIEGGVITIHK